MPFSKSGKWIYWSEPGDTFDFRLTEMYHNEQGKFILGQKIYRHIMKGLQKPPVCSRTHLCPFCRSGHRPVVRYQTTVEISGDKYGVELNETLSKALTQKQRDLEGLGLKEGDILSVKMRVRKMAGSPSFEVTVLNPPSIAPQYKEPDPIPSIMTPDKNLRLASTEVELLRELEGPIRTNLLRNPKFKFRESLEATLRQKSWMSQKRAVAQKFFTDSGEFIEIKEYVE